MICHRPGSSEAPTGSSARGLTGDWAVSHDVDPDVVDGVTLDLRHAGAPLPNAVLR